MLKKLKTNISQKSSNTNLNKFGFTLAEVLITLVIIGIVAAITIPILNQKQQEKTAVTGLKKAFSALSQAYILAVKENGAPDEWDLVASTSPQGAENILNTFAKYMRVLKNCGRNSGCYPATRYKNLNGDFYGSDVENNAAYAKAILNDGSYLFMTSYGSCTTYSWGSTEQLKNPCGDIYVDINGKKPPNQFGIDLFGFYLTTKAILPTGSQNDTSGYTFSGSCKNGRSSLGWGCTAWVIENQNLDYLNCSDLSWSSKRECD